jgi:sugar/nucleoside kinase (ribokinase family)
MVSNNRKHNPVAAVGMASLDTVFSVDNFPLDDGKFIANTIGTFCGGMACNVALNLLKLGQPVKLITWIDNKAAGKAFRKMILQYLSADTIFPIQKGRTSRTSIFVHSKTAHRAAVMHGFPERPRTLLHSQRVELRNASIIFYDGSWPEISEELFTLASTYNIPITSNVEFMSDVSLHTFRSSYYAVASRHFFFNDEMPRTEQIRKVLREQWQPHHRLIGITMGQRGFCFYDGTSFYERKGFKAVMRDSTGAGDAFQAGLITAILNSWSYPRALKLSAAVASLKCSVYGPNLAPLQIENLMSEALKITGEAMW